MPPNRIGALFKVIIFYMSILTCTIKSRQDKNILYFFFFFFNTFTFWSSSLERWHFLGFLYRWRSVWVNNEGVFLTVFPCGAQVGRS